MVAAEMPPSLLTLQAETGEVLLLRSDPEISPEKAAAILGISRPLVYQRMDSGKLPFRLIGRHRRVLVNDVMTLKRLEDQRRGLTDALDLDTGEATGPATTTEKSLSSARLPKSSDIDQLVLGTTNAPYR
ncbi:excisionase family DNA binding protein [Bradyrhizobium elkanii]|nr:excisionase family DNA binding protein [Bradyrhizobium elkanii]